MFVILFVGLLSWLGVISTKALIRAASNLGNSGSEGVPKALDWFKKPSEKVVVETVVENPPARGAKVSRPDPQTTNVSQNRQVSRGVEFETPVRSFSPQARWVESTKMFRDDHGFFVTPPNLLMWDGDRGNMKWIAPFEEFSKFHPQQAERIAQRYANSRLNYEYFNVEGIVRKYGPRARPR